MDEDERDETTKRRPRKDADEALKHVLSDRTGRKFVFALLEGLGIHDPIFPSDALSMAYAEGRRSAGLELRARALRACPGSYAQMQNENQENRNV
jgi:hypothetical protein